MSFDPVSERFGWSGFYVGGHGGIAAGNNAYGFGLTGAPPVVTLSNTAGGGLFGAQVGYDWQIGHFVVGGVADIAWSGHQTNLTLGLVGLGSVSIGSRLNYLGTVRVRGGYTFDRALVYAHGGLAYGSTTQTISVTPGGTLFTATQGRTGWTVGAGIEYALTNRISIGTEYAYVNFGNRDVFNNGVLQFTENLRFHSIKALVNYRF